MKSLYIFIAIVGIIIYNGFLIKRDRQMFEAYDQACAVLPQPHPDCRYAK